MTETETDQTSARTSTSRPREQKLAFYHPNSAGNGAALQIEPRLNRREADRYNCFFLEMAPQKTTAQRDGQSQLPATFDWEHKLTVKLDFADICELLLVLEGRAEKAGGQRNGLYHQTGKASTVITLQKNTDKGGYFLGLSKKENGGNLTRHTMLLTEAEALGLRSIFQGGLFFVMFHAHLFPAGGQAAT